MPMFYFSLENEAAVLTTAEMDCPDADAACDCAVQLLSTLFARMHDDAPDWSRCRIRVAGTRGADILVSSAAQAALLERDQFRLDADVRTDH
jgi:uncharacterized protein DUF6894